MKKGLFASLLPHLIAIVVFVLVALIYCRPALEGKILQQSDITQWKAMVQNSFEHKEKFGRFPLWSNSMFSGMPAYQIAMEADVPVSTGFILKMLSLGLPSPFSFFVLACICFYILSQILRVNPYIGIIGSLAYAYATYNPIIISVGHETKMNAIALMPALVGSVLLIFQRKYLLGAALTALFTCFMIGVNHFQIAYYTFIIIGFMSVWAIVEWIRAKEFKHMGLALGIALVAGLTGVLANAVTLLTTYEYAEESIRGGSELPSDNKTATKDGLSTDYALSYSMYKTEPFVMMVPMMFGGSNALEVAEEDSKAIETLRQMPQELGQQLQYNLGAYWGGIGGTSGPPYVGAIICFLTLIGFFILDSRYKWWVLAASVLAILMSWGSFFEGFNVFLLNTLPFYNKFRAPSMTIVIPTFLFCMMAILTLQKIIYADNRDELWDRYKKGLALTGGVFVVLLLIYFSADYRSEGDRSLLAQTASAQQQVQEYIRTFLESLKEDRKGLFMGSLLRSFFFIAAAAVVLWLSVRNRLSKTVVLSLIGVLAFVDVIAIDTRYLSEKNFEEASQYETAFTPSPADQQILKDTSYYRVFDLRQGIGSALGLGYTLPSYFHHSVGGYHPAKLSIYQDLIEKQLQNFPQSLPVYNMLNTKYIIQKDQQGQDQVVPNTEALGAAWFVKGFRFENGPAAVMNALSNFNPRDTAVLFSTDKSQVPATLAADSASGIQFVYNNNDEVAYRSNSASPGFAVFSEVFYNKGWKALIDGKESPIIRTNYVLRGLTIPAGQHQIQFVFHPAAYYTGQTLTLIASIVILLTLMVAAYFTFRQKRSAAAA
jgi:hypothetical protein